MHTWCVRRKKDPCSRRGRTGGLEAVGRQKSRTYGWNSARGTCNCWFSFLGVNFAPFIIVTTHLALGPRTKTTAEQEKKELLELSMTMSQLLLCHTSISSHAPASPSQSHRLQSSPRYAKSSLKRSRTSLCWERRMNLATTHRYMK